MIGNANLTQLRSFLLDRSFSVVLAKSLERIPAKMAEIHSITSTWYCMRLKCHTEFSPQQTFFFFPSCFHFLIEPGTLSQTFPVKWAFWADWTPFDKAQMLTNNCHSCRLHSLNSRELLTPGSWLLYSHCFGTYPCLKPLQVIRRLFK